MTTAADIARTLRGKRSGGGWTCRCPNARAHRRGDRKPSFSICDTLDGRALFKCHNPSCDPRDVIDALIRLGLWQRLNRAETDRNRPRQRVSPPPKNNASRIAFARALWTEARDPRGTLAQVYLEHRTVGLPDVVVGRVLRFHPRCPFDEVRRPCLVAAFRSILGDKDPATPPRAIHRIALQPDGRSHDGKRMLGPVDGCAIKLSPDEHISSTLGIAEGLETALSVMAAGWRPVWAVGSAGSIEKFPVLPDIEHLTIFADNDASGTGQRAADVCAARWRRAGGRADILTPREVGTDWADAWASRARRL
jgi:putative DNA primase/helicase